MDIEELLTELGITLRGNYSEEDNYVIDISNSNEYGRINSTLDRSDILEFIEDSSFLTEENANMTYKYEDDYMLNLMADFDENTYQLVIIPV